MPISRGEIGIIRIDRASLKKCRAAQSLHFEVSAVFLGREDGAAVLARLQALVAAGNPPGPADLMDLILLPMMRHRRPMLEVVDAAVDRVGQLPREQQERAVACLAGMDPAPGTAARQLSGDTRRSVGYRH